MTTSNEPLSGQLNKQQLLMLRLLKKPLPDADFDQMRRLAVRLLTKQLDEAIEDWENKNGIDEASYDAMLNEHFRTTNSLLSAARCKGINLKSESNKK